MLTPAGVNERNPMTSRLRVDIETYCEISVKDVGPYRYAAHPSFEIIMAAWSLDGGPITVETDPDSIRDIPGLWDPEVIKVAHNAQFERICFSSFAELPPGEYLDPEQWDDTMAMGAEWGYPQSLERMGKALGTSLKDPAGERLIKIFCMPVKGKRILPQDRPEEWMDFCDYCAQDVQTLIEIEASLVEKFGGWPTAIEREVYLTDQHVNDNGIAIDTSLARRATAVAEQNQARHKFEICDLSEYEIMNPGSGPQMLKWLNGMGVPMTNMQKDTVTRYLDHEDIPDVVREVLTIRQELALVASKKFASALTRVLPDGRLRGSFRFFGAHTGRWSGQGTQVQNLPREQLGLTEDQEAAVEFMLSQGMKKERLAEWISKQKDANTEDAIKSLKEGNGVDSFTLKALVRSMFTGPFTVVDYSAIEARVIAWLAGESWALKAFNEGRDIYVETAERMSTEANPLNRSQGKVAVLALGYQGAINSLRAMGAEGNDEELLVLVKQWRRANPSIVKLWELMQDAFGDPGPAGPVIKTTHSHDLQGLSTHLWLPSGRAITYHGVKWEKYVMIDPITNAPKKKEGWRFINPGPEGGRFSTYGGRLAENVTQAVAREIMAAAMVRLRKEGIKIVGHVHDEVIMEGLYPMDEVIEIMCQVPDWAAGMPIDGAGFVCQRYRKG